MESDVTLDDLRRKAEAIKLTRGQRAQANTSTSSSGVPDVDVCPKCKERPAFMLTVHGTTTKLPCETCRGVEPAEAPAAKVEKAAEDRASRLRENLDAIGVNVRKYVDQSPASFNAFDCNPDEGAYQAARQFVEEFKRGDRSSLYLFGRRPNSALAPGNGKTMLAVSILRALAMDPAVPIKDLRFVFVPELLLEIQDTFDDPSRSMLDVVRAYTRPELLVWDDFGAEKMSDFAVRTLYTILYKREGRANVFTSNLSLDQIEARDAYAERITSRIAGDARIVELRGPDRRMRPRQVAP